MQENKNRPKPIVSQTRSPGIRDLFHTVRTAILLLIFGCISFREGVAEILNLPPRAAKAPSGSECAKRIASLAFAQREEAILEQVLAGNVPDFLRQLSPISITNVLGGQTNIVSVHVTPDYLAIGTDADYFLAPMSPMTAQKIADRAGCFLPTPLLVDAIYRSAAVKLAPSPIAPSAAMTTVPVFTNHNATVRAQRTEHLSEHPLGALVAGHKKDVVICEELHGKGGKVAIYGWHQTNGVPIQPLYLGHTVAWVDYSHGIRLVHKKISINGKPADASQVLTSSSSARLLSEQGTLHDVRYRTDALPPLPPASSVQSIPRSGNQSNGQSKTPFGESVQELTFEPGVKIHINAPAPAEFKPDKPVQLIFYALPNGNTTAQTIGKKMQPGDDWHFDIQHIGAQTRFLRDLVTNRTLVIAYLEADTKSWPAWRKQHGDDLIPQLFARVKKIFGSNALEIVLTGHSGGGSLTFGYLNAVKRIPDDVVRIAFLDSNYAYDETQGHDTKLAEWLKASERHHLCVLAYNDAVALLNGKSFVSASGGTWGRSKATLTDLGEFFEFKRFARDDLEIVSALDGRLQFLLMENPEQKILHTVQVERNGFIHAMVSGTQFEGNGYEYFGARAYENFIQAE